MHWMELCRPNRRRASPAKMMSLAAWGLTRSPFSGAGWSFFDGESQAEGLARLRFVAAGGLSAIIVGPRGVGKSQLIARFAAECRRRGQPVAVVDVQGLTPREALWQLASQFSLGPRTDDDAPRLQRRLADFAASTSRERVAPIVLVDNADELGPDVRAQLWRLAATSGGRGQAISLAYVATPAGALRLGVEIADRIDLRIAVEPWSEADTIGYVQHALVAAGCDRPAFDDESLGVLYALSEGVPRQVNRLADHALMGAAAEGLEQVDAAMVEAAHGAVAWTAGA